MWSLIAHILVAVLAAGVAAERRLLLREITNPAGKCRNTVQGLNLITDDRGVLCKRAEFTAPTGCCGSGQQHDCSMCTLHDKCCLEFEACVSCCLAPKHNAATLAKEVLRSPRHKDSGLWGDPFDFCTGVCRTHSRSTAHENAYISSRHHCFSVYGRPSVSDPLPPGVLDGVTVVLGDANDSCETACSKRQKRCSEQHLPWLNSCDRLREHAGCEAGCELMHGSGSGGPAYVEQNDNKATQPAVCFFMASQNSLTCVSKEQHYRRLCPCV